MERAGFHHPPDRAPPEAEADELPPRDYAVLLLGEPRLPEATAMHATLPGGV
jgi:hypothetical protein